jgi:hypothetical protein
VKYDDVQIGERYAVNHGGSEVEAEVLDKGEKTVRVYSGARHDFRGHDSTAKRVHLRYVAGGRDDWVLARQITRPWVEAGEAQAEAKRAKDALAARLRAVQAHLPSAGWHWTWQGKQDHDHVVVGLDELEALLGSLSQEETP